MIRDPVERRIAEDEIQLLRGLERGDVLLLEAEAWSLRGLRQHGLRAVDAERLARLQLAVQLRRQLARPAPEIRDEHAWARLDQRSQVPIGLRPLGAETLVLRGAPDVRHPPSVLRASARRRGDLRGLLEYRHALPQALVQELQLHRAAGAIEQREREARSLQIRDILVQAGENALARAADAAEVLELRGQRVRRPQVALPRRGILRRPGRARELRGPALQVVFQRGSRGA